MRRPIQRRLPLVTIFLSFRVLWGGGGADIRSPAVRGWLRPLPVRGLTLAQLALGGGGGQNATPVVFLQIAPEADLCQGPKKIRNPGFAESKVWDLEGY